MVFHQILPPRKSQQSHSLAIMAPLWHICPAIGVPALSLMPPTSSIPSAAPQHAGPAAISPVPLPEALQHGSGELRDWGHTCAGSPALNYTDSPMQVFAHCRSWPWSLSEATSAGCWWSAIHLYCHLRPYCWPRAQGAPAMHRITVCLLYTASLRE